MFPVKSKKIGYTNFFQSLRSLIMRSFIKHLYPYNLLSQSSQKIKTEQLTSHSRELDHQTVLPMDYSLPLLWWLNQRSAKIFPSHLLIRWEHQSMLIRKDLIFIWDICSCPNCLYSNEEDDRLSRKRNKKKFIKQKYKKETQYRSLRRTIEKVWLLGVLFIPQEIVKVCANSTDTMQIYKSNQQTCPSFTNSSNNCHV